MVVLTLGPVSAMLAWPELLDAVGLGDELDLGGGTDGARSVLSVVAGGLMTVASMVFSLAFVALTLTAQTLGPRVMDFALRDQSAKVLPGLCLSGFLVSVLGLAAAANGAEGAREAGIAAMVAAALAALALVWVAVFATRMADLVRADAVVARLARAFSAAAARPEAEPPAPEDQAVAEALIARLSAEGVTVRHSRSGYIDAIDPAGLLTLASERGWTVSLLVRENDFLSPGRPVARVLGASAEAPEEVAKEVCAHLALGDRRRLSRLPDFEGDALVEVALRALSPGVNDPMTALACIDGLTEGLSVALRAPEPRRLWRDSDGAARLARPDCGAAWLAPRLLAPIAEEADAPMVVLRLAERLNDLSALAARPHERAALADLGGRIARRGRSLGEASDRAAVARAVEAAAARLGASSQSPSELSEKDT